MWTYHTHHYRTKLQIANYRIFQGGILYFICDLFWENLPIRVDTFFSDLLLIKA